MWTEFKHNEDHYPPEGITVVITDGELVDTAYFLWSSEYRWVKIDDGLDDEVDLPFEPTHWMFVDDYKVYCREQKIEEILCQRINL